jgi:hypothetical protein
MGADAGIHIRIKGIDNEEPVNIPDIGTGDDFSQHKVKKHATGSNPYGQREFACPQKF